MLKIICKDSSILIFYTPEINFLQSCPICKPFYQKKHWVASCRCASSTCRTPDPDGQWARNGKFLQEYHIPNKKHIKLYKLKKKCFDFRCKKLIWWFIIYMRQSFVWNANKKIWGWIISWMTKKGWGQYLKNRAKNDQMCNIVIINPFHSLITFSRWCSGFRVERLIFLYNIYNINRIRINSES